jgi:hypothetical protein
MTMPTMTCPACRFDASFSASYRLEPRGPDESSGFGFAWILGAAHVMALVVEGKPVALELCPDHRRQLIEEIEEKTDRPCRVLTEGPNVGHPYLVFKTEPS